MIKTAETLNPLHALYLLIYILGFYIRYKLF